MQLLKYSVFVWALVVHALVDGEYQDVIIETYNTELQCNKSRENQNIHGDCYEIERIIHSNVF